MKATLNILTAIVFCIIQITACQKKTVTPPVEAELCKITHMNTDHGGGTFTYNAYGNPRNIIMDRTGTGNPHMTFLYDKYNRLTDHIGTYVLLPDSIGTYSDLSKSQASFIFEFWYRYTYADENASSLPIADTARYVGGYSAGKFGIVSQTFPEIFVYDSQKRIAQVITVNSVFARTYNYDANGNLIRPNVTYDNKKNWRLTNKVWMLIDRNFSKNNPFIATAYNSEGYPTVFPDPASSPTLIDNFWPRQRGIYTMDYSCSMAQSAQ